MKLSTAITHFDTQLRADGKSERTRQAYLGDLGKLKCWLKGDVHVSKVAPDTLARFLADGNGEVKSALTVNRINTALRVFFRFLTDAGYTAENPARLVRSTPTDLSDWRMSTDDLSTAESSNLTGRAYVTILDFSRFR